MRRISQREARRLRKRVNDLESAERKRRYVWAQDWPGAAEIMRWKWEKWHEVPVAIRTARRLKHGVIVLADDEGTVRFLGLPLQEESK